jgi:hypothetical protein
MATLSKESFCKALALIKEQDHINDRVSEALELVCGNRVVYGTSSKYFEALLLVMKEALPDKYGYIDWWLYEAPSAGYHVELADGSKTWELKDPESLYDFIVNDCP